MMLFPSKLIFLVLIGNVVQFLDGNEISGPIQESPLNFDIDAKKKSPLPTCHFSYQYDLARAILSALCFIIAAFILVFGKCIIFVFSIIFKSDLYISDEALRT